MRRATIGFCSALVLCALAMPTLLRAEHVQEFDLKAAFIYNFALYTEWPLERAAARGRITICANPKSGLLPALESLDGKAIKSQRIAVRALVEVGAARDCNLLVLGPSDRSRWVALLRAVRRTPVLTIADDPDGDYDGAMLTLGVESERIVFDVNTRAAALARLRLSSKLLRLGRMVQ